MNIDVHWHYMPEAAIERLGDEGSRFRSMTELFRPDLQLAEMNRRRIDLAEVSPMPGLFQYQLRGLRSGAGAEPCQRARAGPTLAF